MTNTVFKANYVQISNKGDIVRRENIIVSVKLTKHFPRKLHLMPFQIDESRKDLQQYLS